MAARELTEGSAIQQYCLLAKSTKGRACVAVIEQALNAANLYVFGELLDMPNVAQLEGTDNAAHLALLRVFTYGTYGDYRKQQASLPPLTPNMATKLRQLTIVSLASIQSSIPYTVLLRELDINNVRELEDLIIESIYAGVIKGKLDQKEQHLEVEYSIGRDILPEQLQGVISVLSQWAQRSDHLLQMIDEKMRHADKVHEEAVRERKDFETQLEQLKSTLKVIHDQNDLMQGTSYDDASEFFDDNRQRKSSRSSKMKGHRMRPT
eukprot:TRINITY_DN1949_c0_g1_i2.p1 TRINITY_DN1949_c0_g1~~TRINITY_DN1949_c0_g1_i2.p1  ORF type:complete len:286 (-),score=82.16 TRINITY_DN1949_c0_g1_i2:66-860(-)